MKFLIIASLIALGMCQFEETTPKPWPGPFADHKIGQPPADTPEVAAAKAHLANQYKYYESILPTLPPELRYIKPTESSINQVNANVPEFNQQRSYVPQPQNIAPVSQYVPQAQIVPQVPQFTQRAYVPEPQVQQVQQGQWQFQPQAVNQDFGRFASAQVPQIPAEPVQLAPTGETQEVYNARKAHLEAYAKAKAQADAINAQRPISYVMQNY